MVILSKEFLNNSVTVILLLYFSKEVDLAEQAVQHSHDHVMGANVEFAADYVSAVFVEEVYKCANPFSVLAFNELIDTLVELLDQHTIELDFSCVALGVVDDEVGEVLSFDGCLVLCKELAELFVP